jgi:hypothetical protein
MGLSIGVYLNVDHHNDLAILVVPNQIVVSYIGWPHCWVTLNNLIPCGSYDRPFLWLEGHNCSFMFESSSSLALFEIKTSIQEISLCSITLTWKLEKVTFCTFKTLNPTPIQLMGCFETFTHLFVGFFFKIWMLGNWFNHAFYIILFFWVVTCLFVSQGFISLWNVKNNSYDYFFKFFFFDKHTNN